MKQVKVHYLLFLIILFSFISFRSISQTLAHCDPPPPIGFPILDNGPLYATSENRRLWRVGQTITVRFVDEGTPLWRDKIIKAAREWELYANVKFSFVVFGPADIRISFKPGGSYSYVGTNASLIPEESETMNFGFDNTETTDSYITYIDGVILHEFGHALGLWHEHQNPRINIQWDKEAIYRNNEHLTRTQVDAIYFDKKPEDAVYFCEHDPASIMHYPVPQSFTLNDYSIPYASTLSREDKRFIAALYPFSGTRNSLSCGFCNDATCGEATYSLTANSIRSNGTINIEAQNESLFSCSSNCSKSYRAGQVLQLTAVPNEGYQFVSWIDTPCSTTTSTTCTFTINKSLSISALFEPIGGQPQVKNQTLLQQDNFQYIGAFKVPTDAVNGSNFNFGGKAPVYNPVNNSLVMVGHAHHQMVAEITIPKAVNSSNLENLYRARFLQPFTDVTEGKLSTIDPTDTRIGGLLLHNGNLITSAYAYYVPSNSQVGSHFQSSLDWSRTGEVQDPYKLGTLGMDFVSGYMTHIPTDWQDDFGGPALTGNCCLGIISRTSFGPAASVFDPSDLGFENPVPATPLLYYPQANPLADWDETSPLFNSSTEITGILFPENSRSVLFFGRHGTGTFCQGTGEACDDPVLPYSYSHAYPYIYQVWAYDALDLLAVKNGTKQAWEIQPYATWELDLPFPEDSKILGGIAYDREAGLLYVSQQKVEGFFGKYPVMHVFKINNENTAANRSRTVTEWDTALQQNLAVAPNPTGTATTIYYEVAEPSMLTLELYDVRGKKVMNILPNTSVSSGKYQQSVTVSHLNKGIYILTMKTQDKVMTEKIIIQ